MDASGFEHPRLIPIDIGLRTRFLPAEVVGGKTQDLQTLRTPLRVSPLQPLVL